MMKQHLLQQVVPKTCDRLMTQQHSLRPSCFLRHSDRMSSMSLTETNSSLCDRSDDRSQKDMEDEEDELVLCGLPTYSFVLSGEEVGDDEDDSECSLYDADDDGEGGRTIDSLVVARQRWAKRWQKDEHPVGSCQQQDSHRVTLRKIQSADDIHILSRASRLVRFAEYAPGQKTPSREFTIDDSVMGKRALGNLPRLVMVDNKENAARYDIELDDDTYLSDEGNEVSREVCWDFDLDPFDDEIDSIMINKQRLAKTKICDIDAISIEHEGLTSFEHIYDGHMGFDTLLPALPNSVGAN